MAKSKYGNVLLELCSIKFKVQGADDTTFMRQQSKNIRTNICILDKINNIKKKLKYILYMDRKGREAYLALLYQHNDIVIYQHIIFIALIDRKKKIGCFIHTKEFRRT